jgi:hypothetical protein
VGSSVHLVNHMKEVGLKHMRFICLAEYATRGDLVYAEVDEQVRRDVLRARCDKGERIYYNGQIAAIKYIPANKKFNYNKELDDEYTLE